MRLTTTRLALACGTLALTGTALAQPGHYYGGYGYVPVYDNGYQPYVRPYGYDGYNAYDHQRYESHRYDYDHQRYEYSNRRTEEERRRRRERNAEIAVGAAVVGGILGYALSQAQTPPDAPSATQGYVVQPVQPVYTQPVYTPPAAYPAPSYPYGQQPYPSQYQPYQYNGRTYYRPAQ